jgi:alpha-methylacyl-CoA racemase
MLLADMGAEVIRIERISGAEPGLNLQPRFQLLNRSRQSVAVNLKDPQGVAVVLRLCSQADAIFEGFRPGVMERLGLGPEACMAVNPRLVYGRMTGWGQTGSLAKAAGHDPNYIAITGVLDAIGGRDGPPVLPLNLIGDFGGGGVYLAMGLLAGLLEARQSGQGQVIDCAMVDGAASLMTLFFGMSAAGAWQPQRGHNIVDGGAHFFNVYRTRDDKFIVIAPMEPRFYQILLDKLGLNDPAFEHQYDRNSWPQLREKLQAKFLTRSRDEWCALFEGTDACVSPVLALSETHAYPFNKERGTFVDYDGIVQPAPAPRFSRTSPEIQAPPDAPGGHTLQVLGAWGFSEDELRELSGRKVIKQGDQ